MSNTDSETGEYVCQTFESMAQPSILVAAASTSPDYDMETGEPDHTTIIVTKNKPKFIIPKSLIKRPSVEKKCCIGPNESFTLCCKEEIINLKEVGVFFF